MAKSKKPQNEEEVLGQIFDFIFKQAKKPVSKRKPIKLKSTGISTSGAVVDGIVAALEKPGLFVTDQMLSTMNDALTIEFGRMKADEAGAFKAKFTTTSMVDFLKDPNKFLSKPLEDAKIARKSSRAAFVGKTLEGLHAYAWARKYNLDLDARKAIEGKYAVENLKERAGGTRAFQTAAAAIATNTQDSERQYIASRSADLIGKEVFGREGWELMDSARKAEFKKALFDEKQGISAEKYFDRYASVSDGRYVATLKDRYAKLKESYQINKKGEKKYIFKGGIDLFDDNQYLLLENRNIKGRVEDMQLYLKRHPNLKKSEIENINKGIAKLQQAEVLISDRHFSLDDIPASRKEIQNNINDIQKELVKAKKAGDKDKVKDYKDQIKALNSMTRELSWMSFWGQIGKREGQLNSIKAVMGEGNAIIAVLDGSFYDKNANSFALPNNETLVSLGSHLMTRTDEKGNKVTKPESEDIKIYVAKKSKNKVKNTYYQMMTDMYYWTPKSIMKTLFVNGEGFIYRNYKETFSIAKKIGLDPDKTSYDQLIAKLATMGKKERAYMLKLKTSKRLSEIFSFGQRKRDMIQSWFDEHVYKQLRRRVYNSLIDKVKGEGAQLLMKQWLAKGGFQVIGRALATTILTAIGVGVTGGLGAFLVPIVSGVIVDVLYGGLKVILQVNLLVIAGVLGIVFYGMSSSKESFDAKAYSYTNTPPGEVVINPNFRGTSPIVGENDPGGIMEDFIGGTLPKGEKCLLGSGSFYCSQGPYGNYSHKKVAAIDVTGVSYFYAPTFCGDNNCKVTSYGPTTCTNGAAGGMLIFTASYGGDTYEFKLIHVASTFGAGATLSSGQRVARVMTLEETTNACSSGKHIHIQTKMNGSVVDPRGVLGNSTSKGGFSCDISTCAL